MSNLSELGLHLQDIVKRLQANQTLVKLLYYTDHDPLAGADLTETQIKTLIYEKLIKIVPFVNQAETANSILAIKVDRGYSNSLNYSIHNISFSIDVFVPMTQQVIKNSNLRPFAILGEIQRSLLGKKIDGLGEIIGGDQSLNFLTDRMSCYEINFKFKELQ